MLLIKENIVNLKIPKLVTTIALKLFVFGLMNVGIFYLGLNNIN